MAFKDDDKNGAIRRLLWVRIKMYSMSDIFARIQEREKTNEGPKGMICSYQFAGSVTT